MNLMAKKVLKHGDPDKINGLKYFRCDYCGCVFEAEKSDYWGGDQRDPGYYSSCPDCGAGCSETRKPKDAKQLHEMKEEL